MSKLPQESHAQAQERSGGETWTIQRILGWTQRYFVEKGIASPRLDAELLLAATLGKNRVHLYTHFDQPLTTEERDSFREKVKRRAAREPVAYILGQREFYGRPFVVNRDVLIPRPETEHLVDAVCEWVKGQALAAPRIVDLGVGSGAIAITLACELEGAKVMGTDLSEAALAVARTNSAALGTAERVELLQGNLYAPVEGRCFDVVVSNPPYVAEQAYTGLEPEVRSFEPALALVAAEEGLAVIRSVLAGAWSRLATPGLLACEIGFDQEAAVSAALAAAGAWAAVRVARDLQGHPRVAIAEKR